MARTSQWHRASGIARTDHNRIGGSGDEKKEIWTTLLDKVASGRKLSEKTLMVLGGTPDSQKEFIEALSQESHNSMRPQDRNKNRKIPIANQFALGYTYQNVYDVDHEGQPTRARRGVVL